MGTGTATRAIEAPRALRRLDAAAIAAWLLPAATIVYLGMRNGGYDAVVRNEVGLALSWILLVGVATAAVAPLAASRRATVALALLAAFAAWTALSVAWSQSAERSVEEAARVATYLAAFALALAICAGGRGRQLLNGAFAGVAAIALVAVCSRLQPGWFPDNVTGRYLPGIEIESRLAYPLNYSSGLGALAAMGLPLALAVTHDARTIAGRALAGAWLPLLGLCIYLTTSAGAVVIAVSGVLAYLLLAGDRVPKLVTLAIAGLGTVILCAGVDDRAALDRGLATPAAERQGDELTALVLLVCGGVALLSAALALALRYGPRPSWTLVSKRVAARAAVGGAAIAIVAALAAGLPARLDRGWDDFREPAAAGLRDQSRARQITNLSGSGRYQFWSAAKDANATAPLLGLGAGTFELWWARHGSYAGFVRDSHSLYFDALAELGVIGTALIVLFVLAAVAGGVVRTVRAPPATRELLAGATAACVVFAVAAALDWIWELAVVPVVFVACAAVALALPPEAPAPAPAPSRRARAIVAVAAALAVAATVLPLAADSAVLDSRDQARQGRLADALERATAAVKAQPYAATPRLQQALVLELAGDLDGAAIAARAAAQRDTKDWRTWLTVSRIAARRGRTREAVEAFRRARDLNPRSGLFAR